MINLRTNGHEGSMRKEEGNEAKNELHLHPGQDTRNGLTKEAPSQRGMHASTLANTRARVRYGEA